MCGVCTSKLQINRMKCDNKIGLISLICFLSVILYAPTVDAGECCLANTNLVGQTYPETWCSNYCCSVLTIQKCCDDVTLRAPDSVRSPVCAAWFRAHVWAPILIAIGGVIFLFLITCCCCCCCACCRNKQPGTVVVQGQQTPSVVIAQQSTNMSTTQAYSDPYRTGYNQ